MRLRPLLLNNCFCISIYCSFLWKVAASYAINNYERQIIHSRYRVALGAIPVPEKNSNAKVAEQERPIDPQQLLPDLTDKIGELLDWWRPKSKVVCLTGAGLSTESGLKDYRGYKGSYYEGHKPIVHDQFMQNESSRKQYWGRSLVGWRDFDSSEPNSGHGALVDLEKIGKIGVHFQDRPDYYDDDLEWNFSSGLQKLSIITQNVDSLHRRAGSRHVTELHGRGNILKCMSCGKYRCRNDFHDDLEEANRDWYLQVTRERADTRAAVDNKEHNNYLRPDGDGFLERETYDDVIIPPCTNSICKEGFMKPDVVFFGDIVPTNRIDVCSAAVEASDGLLCIGSSLAVHSAYQFVRHAAKYGIPIAILNVGETRAENDEALLLLANITKIEAPAGATLSACAAILRLEQQGPISPTNTESSALRKS